MPNWRLKIQTLQNALGLGVRALATLMGLSFKTLYRLKAGDRPSPDAARKVLAAEASYAQEIAKWRETGEASPPARLPRPKDLEALGRTRALPPGRRDSRTTNLGAFGAPGDCDAAIGERFRNAGHPAYGGGPPYAIRQ